MYIETIYILCKERKDIHAIDICEYLGYSKPSVSRAMGILKKGGYIVVDEESHIRLTEEGLKIAETMYERHTILTNLLTSIGVDEVTASEDACKIEHVISETSFEAIKDYFNRKNEKVDT